MKNKFFLISFVSLSIISCKIEHVHVDPLPSPPVYETPETCMIVYGYVEDIELHALKPFVTCAIRDADPYVESKCYMEFRALGLRTVKDEKFVTTDIWGGAKMTISNGNCYKDETITLYAECIVDGERLSSMNTGYIDCGF